MELIEQRLMVFKAGPCGLPVYTTINW